MSLGSGLSAAEQRELIQQQRDDEIRPWLAATYADEHWHKASAVRSFLVTKSWQWDPWAANTPREVKKSIERVIAEDDGSGSGFPRYWFTGHGTFTTLAGMTDEDLIALSSRWGNVSLGFARLKARHDHALVSRGAKVSTAELDAMLAELEELKSQL